MIAKIRTKDNTFYNSVVFAIFSKEWSTKVVCFNEQQTELQTVNFWQNPGVRNVFIFKTDKEDWINGKKTSGYKWFLDNCKITLFKHLKINDSILPTCKSFQEQKVKNIKNKFTITGNEDIISLDTLAFNFHDAHVEKITNKQDITKIEFNTTWDCNIVFELQGDVKTNLYEGFGGGVREDGIYEDNTSSSMFFDEGTFYWVNKSDIKSKDEILTAEDNYFSAKNIKWSFTIH